MTLATFNQCVDSATVGNKTGPLQERPGSRHAGGRDTLSAHIRHIKSRLKGKAPKHLKVAGRHAAPRRAFF